MVLLTEGMVSRISHRYMTVALLALLLGILIAACGGGNRSGNPRPHLHSKQSLYVAALRKDYKSLDRGVLTYSRIDLMKTSETEQFKVMVTDIGRRLGRVSLTSYNGMNVFRQNVPTGGIVGVKIVTCQDLTCTSESYQRQPVLSKGQQASWSWEITAGRPGTALITLRVDTYDRGSAQPLHEEIVPIPIRIVPTPAFNQQQNHARIARTANGLVSIVETIGAVAGSVAAVGGIVGWIAVRARKRGTRGAKRRDGEAQASRRTGEHSDSGGKPA